MAQLPAPSLSPVSEDVFLADRKKFWSSFTTFIFGVAACVAVMLILMAIFLV